MSEGETVELMEFMKIRINLSKTLKNKKKAFLLEKTQQKESGSSLNITDLHRSINSPTRVFPTRANMVRNDEGPSF